MADVHKNFAESLVATAPSPAISDTSLVVTSGEGALFPTPPFNATIWPAGAQPTSNNAEIVRVLAINSDTFTIDRAQEGTTERRIIVGDQIVAAITAQTLMDIENPMATWSPYIFSSASGSALQTIASATGQSSSGSLLVFPITVNGNVKFNRAILPVSLSYTTSSGQGTNKYYSYFGLYSMNNSTALSQIASGSFSMVESFNTLSRTWSLPTTTNTTGYGYGTLAMSNAAQLVNYINGPRWFGLQFGSQIRLTNGIYYMGVMSIRSTDNNSGAGMSVAGIIGQPIDLYHQAGSVNGYNPIGYAASKWGGTNQANSTNWWGQHIVGFLTNLTRTDFGGTAIPSSILLTELAGSAANSTATILPAVSFYSNFVT